MSNTPSIFTTRDSPRSSKAARSSPATNCSNTSTATPPPNHPHRISSQEVNDYLREITGQDFTAKDFRTWAGTKLAAHALRLLKPATSQRQAKRNIVQAVEAVAHILGNTKAVCRKCYIHPALLEAYTDGSLRLNGSDKDCVLAILRKGALK